MSNSTHATASSPDDPALLRIDGPIATITLNRAAAFNSIDLPIAKKLEQLASEVEASDDIRVLVIEGEGRAFCGGGDLQTIGAAAAADTIAPVVGELLKHYHAFIETLRLHWFYSSNQYIFAGIVGCGPFFVFYTPLPGLRINDQAPLLFARFGIQTILAGW